MNQHSTAEVFSQPHNRIRLHLSGPSHAYDARTTAIRVDLADVAEATQYFSPHYAAAVPYVCAAPSAIVRGKPVDSDSAVTQILHGEGFHVLDVRAGWAWGYCAHDHYVGYVAIDALHRDDGGAATHRVLPQGGGALLFSRPDIKSPLVARLPGNARVKGVFEDDFLAISNGYIHNRHIALVGHVEIDWVDAARACLGMPYLWGGRGDGGIDCSGLVQIALAQCGVAVARDTDQQAGTIGRALDEGEPLARGDILFFPGHVGIMSDAQTLLHANAHWMRVVEEPLADVVARLVPTHPQPITARRRIEP
ncbi:C40 family peptidase [Sphingobium sufflavum]|uniref:C40 family peptidase n=1 Tax=Sphingobium sufflavum TaxID=1129547 RepID=UPI001F37EDD7|nr:NlpC/P60 family protein [Sphingobium sufflavum]MCE7796103.1 C40 family peptidase [Sphingobium sufflavum]